MTNNCDYMRFALAQNLKDSSGTFRRLAGDQGGERSDHTAEWLAMKNAAAAVWVAVENGLLNVPVLAKLVGWRNAMGFSFGSMSGADWCNLFASITQHFTYPHGKGLLPRADETQDSFHRQELRAFATGCELLAELVQSGNTERFRSQEQLDLLNQEVVSSLTQFIRFNESPDDLLNQSPDDSQNQELDSSAEIIATCWQLRCWSNDLWPSHLLDSFTLATTPDAERPAEAVDIARDLLRFVENAAGASELAGEPVASNWPTLTPKELRAILGLSPDTVTRRLKSQQIRNEQITTKSYLIDPNSLPDGWQKKISR